MPPCRFGRDAMSGNATRAESARFLCLAPALRGGGEIRRAFSAAAILPARWRLSSLARERISPRARGPSLHRASARRIALAGDGDEHPARRVDRVADATSASVNAGRHLRPAPDRDRIAALEEADSTTVKPFPWPRIEIGRSADPFGERARLRRDLCRRAATPACPDLRGTASIGVVDPARLSNTLMMGTERD